MEHLNADMEMSTNSVLPTTETVLPESQHLDQMSTYQILELINREDAKISAAIAECLPIISTAVNTIVDRMTAGGRLIYVGCGTSGRLAVTDASECPVTFGVSPDKVLGVIAGGHQALTKSMENIEDSDQAGQDDLTKLCIQDNDVVVGASASGSTPYVLGACRYARQMGCSTVGICCNPQSLLRQNGWNQIANLIKIISVDHCIAVVVGAEVLSGSTRMKAGTATKMVLNMISTTSMLKLGECYGGFMVSMNAAACSKLKARASRIVQHITGCDAPSADKSLRDCDFHLKAAIVSRIYDCSKAAALVKLDEFNGKLRPTLDKAKMENVLLLNNN